MPTFCWSFSLILLDLDTSIGEDTIVCKYSRTNKSVTPRPPAVNSPQDERRSVVLRWVLLVLPVLLVLLVFVLRWCMRDLDLDAPVDKGEEEDVVTPRLRSMLCFGRTN